jgi:hypothetical protein
MTEPTQPPRRPLATFLRATPADAATPPVETDAAADDAVEERVVSETLNDADVDTDVRADVGAVAGDAPTDTVDDVPDIAAPPSVAAAEPAVAPAPSFTRVAAAAPRAPRWQWGVVAGLAALLALQITVADRANLAADAGTRPWVAGLCGVLRCTLPAWHEPTAFSMISRDVRPVPTQPGALQVQASFRNDARWAQAWPSLRLSLADADGRVIGSSVFAPQDYLGPAADAGSVLEPGQSAQIAFRVREPAASTVAFTFEFL